MLHIFGSVHALMLYFVTFEICRTSGIFKLNRSFCLVFIKGDM